VCVCVCMCVCLSAIISSELHVGSSPNFCARVCVTYGRGSTVILWRRSDELCTSGFMDDVIFAHKPRLLDVGISLCAQNVRKCLLRVYTPFHRARIVSRSYDKL